MWVLYIVPLLSYYWMRYSNWNLLGLSWLGSWMLCGCVRLCSWCGFEGHGAEGTFKENLAVSALDVGLYRGDISEDHTAVDTAARRSSNLPSFSPGIETVFHCPFLFTVYFRRVPPSGRAAHWPVANPSGVMQAALGDVGLEVDRVAAGATLWTDVRGLVLVDSLVWQETALAR